MRYATTATVLLLISVGLLGACAPSTTTPPATVTVSASPPATSSAPSATPSSTTEAAVGKCTGDDLGARLERRSPDPDAPTQPRVEVVWTNTSPSPCTMYGFGGVDLSGPDQRTFGPTFSLRRSEDTPSTVRLAPGGTAVTTIPFLDGPPAGPDSWTPVRAVVTPPDETRSKELPWTFGPVLRQDGATRPGTFLEPVVAG